MCCTSNSLLNDKILGWSKFKAFADDKIYLTQNLNFVLGRVENMGKGENAGYSVFKMLLFQGRLNWELCGRGLIHLYTVVTLILLGEKLF